MSKEEIILLVKEKRYEEAIKIYVDKQQYQEAEEFCKERPGLGLMTTLLKIFFDKYQLHRDKRNQHLEMKKVNESIEEKKIAGIYRK